MRATPPPAGVDIVTAHTFERAIVLDWFQRDASGDASSHPLLRQCEAKDAKGNRFSLSGGQWSRPGLLVPYGTTLLMGDETPLWPLTLEFGEAAESVVRLDLANDR